MFQFFNTLVKNDKLKNFIIYGIGQAVNIISPLLITPFLIYTCGLDKLGVIAIGQALAYILIVIVDYSSFIIGVKETTINRANYKVLENTFVTNYAVKTLLLIIVLLFLFFLILFVPYFNEIWLTILFSSTIIIGQFINPTWFLQGLENFKAITIINIFGKIIYFIGVFVFINSVDDYVYANLWLGFGTIIANSLGFFWVLKTNKFLFKNLKNQDVITLLKRDFTFCVSQLFFAFRNYSPVIIISFIGGNFIAGQFKVIEQILNFLRTYLQLFFKFSYSYVCFEINKNLLKGKQLWTKFNGLNYIFLVVVLFGVYFFSTPVLEFFRVEEILINKLEKYLHIALFIPLLIGCTLPLEQLIFSLNKNKEYIRITVIITLFNTIGLAFVMKFYQLKEVFFMLIITELILIIAYVALLKPYFTKETK